MTNSVAQVNLDGKVRIGKKTYTVKDSIDHVVANNDTIKSLAKDFADAVIPLYRENGNYVLAMKSMLGDSKQKFGEWIKQTDLAKIHFSDRYNMMLIASEWKLVQEMMKSGELFKKNGDPLGLSSIQKKISEKKKPAEEQVEKKQGSAGNTSKGKPKGSKEPSKAETVLKNTVFETIVPKNEEEFAVQIMDCIEANGFKMSDVIKELMALTNKK